MSSLAQQIEFQFVTHHWTWKIDGHDVVPNVDDIQSTLDRAKELLYDEPIPSQLEVGRLLIRRYADDKFDVYLHFGILNNQEEK